MCLKKLWGSSYFEDTGLLLKSAQEALQTVKHALLLTGSVSLSFLNWCFYKCVFVPFGLGCVSSSWMNRSNICVWMKSLTKSRCDLCSTAFRKLFLWKWHEFPLLLMCCEKWPTLRTKRHRKASDTSRLSSSVAARTHNNRKFSGTLTGSR